MAEIHNRMPVQSLLLWAGGSAREWLKQALRSYLSAAIGKCLPRLRALAFTTTTERFSAIAAAAAETPESSNSIKCSTWADDHDLLAKRTIVHRKLIV
jgi:hypothetical protein